MKFLDATLAFDAAIKEGRLSVDPQAKNYAGHFMYMGTTDAGLDLFKHGITREYDYDPRERVSSPPAAVPEGTKKS
jgi:hypothetical protein